MATSRYLLYVSYIGTQFKGCQRQVKGRFPRLDDPSTVQGRLEMAFNLLNPSNTPVLVLSSRTDAGVHAISTTFHIDLYRTDNVVYKPETITLAVNKYLTKQELPIRVIKTYLVPNQFHCRHNAISRTYLYRFATIKSEASSINMASGLKHIPIEELERCHVLCTDRFDINIMRETANLFLGIHDFRSFMGRGSKEPDKITRRQIDKLEILNGKVLTYSPFSWPTHCNREDYQFYDVYITATGFLYRQVRRMVASLIAVAQGKVSNSDIKLMLQVPSHRTWNDKIKTVPACGLYLCKVEYNSDDRSTFKDCP